MAGGPFYPFDAPGSARTLYIEGGPYGQVVYGAFIRFLQPLATSADRTSAVVNTVGYPITPFFFAQTEIKGASQWVIVQAFERRVLTMTADGLVEFGNIGQHYYQWRYGSNAPPAMIPAPTLDPLVDFSAFAQRWGSHGFQLVVGADGYAHLQSRTYEQCGRINSDPNEYTLRRPIHILRRARDHPVHIDFGRHRFRQGAIEQHALLLRSE